MEQYVAQQVMFFEFAFGQARGEVGTIDRDVEFLQDVRERAEMIFVPVREDDGGDVFAIFVEKTEVRDGDIDSVRGLFGKTHASVENQHLVAITHCHAIHPKLADTAERNDLKNTTHFWLVLYSPSTD